MHICSATHAMQPWRIYKAGTAVKYTECSLGSDGTYSNGSFYICKQHTKCEDLGLEEITPGNNSVDAQCGVKKKKRDASLQHWL